MKSQNSISAFTLAFIIVSCSDPCHSNSDPLFNLFKSDFNKLESFDNAEDDTYLKRRPPIILAEFASCVFRTKFRLDHIINDLKQLKSWPELFNPYLRKCKRFWPRERKCHLQLHSELSKCYEERDFFWIGMYTVAMDFICDAASRRKLNDIFKNGAWDCLFRIARLDVGNRLRLCFQSRSINDLSRCLNSLSSICEKETTRSGLRSLLNIFSESFQGFQRNTNSSSTAEIVRSFFTSTSSSLNSSSTNYFLPIMNDMLILLVFYLLYTI